MSQLISVEYIIFGEVQGVFFRKYAQEEAKILGVRGTVCNDNDGTVKGTLEGERTKVEQMKFWLQTKGSPQSRIDQAVFLNEHEIMDYSFDSFTITK